MARPKTLPPRGKAFLEVKRAMRAGELDAFGAKARLADQLGVSRQRIAQLIDEVKREEDAA